MDRMQGSRAKTNFVFIRHWGLHIDLNAMHQVMGFYHVPRERRGVYELVRIVDLAIRGDRPPGNSDIGNMLRFPYSVRFSFGFSGLLEFSISSLYPRYPRQIPVISEQPDGISVCTGPSTYRRSYCSIVGCAFSGIWVDKLQRGATHDRGKRAFAGSDDSMA